jgi:carbamoyl-phosphate synthase large subunit
MAIGRTFQESLQKALRGLEVGVDGFNLKTVDPDNHRASNWRTRRPERLWYVADAFGVKA